MKNDKAFLIILDGWGLGENPESSAIAQANTSVMESLLEKYPNSTLVTHGEDVGLPEGQMGNSEVGHLNIGAGRIVYQDLARINLAIKDGSFYSNQVLTKALSSASQNSKAVHIMGLLSNGGVHSHIKHLKAIIKAAQNQKCEKVYIHAFMDGRDVDPRSGKGFLEDIQSYVKDKPAQIATVIGRYFAMDRDQRWERIQKAYDLLIHAKGDKATDPIVALQRQYDNGTTDEFIEPLVCVSTEGEPVATINEGDTVIFYNFRTDRPRQLVEVLTKSTPEGTEMKPLSLDFVTMSRYSDKFKDIEVMYEKNNLTNTLGEVISDAGKTQLRIAETEKYPHVTFFFSGGREDEFDGESRGLVHSPKVATYDLQPEMSAKEVTNKALDHINAEDAPDFICLNFANTDMVGHTGVFSAAIRAAEYVDRCVGILVDAALDNGYQLLIIADHGNADYMINEDGSPNTAHTMNLVPCVYVSNEDTKYKLHDGRLADVAPTILEMLGLDKSDEMTGKSLLKKQ